MDIRQEFQHKLESLVGDVLRLGSMVDVALQKAVTALVEDDISLAQQVVAEDEQMNRLRYYIEEHSVALIATQQPLARDLRTIIAVMYLATNLERMGDHAAGVARLVLRMHDVPYPRELLPTFEQMSHIGREMLRDALNAFVNNDEVTARQIGMRDDELDDLYNDLVQRLIREIAQQPDYAQGLTYLLWVAHNLERIGDRVTNICERTIYMVSGELVEFVDDMGASSFLE